MRLKITLFISTALILWLSVALVRVENERYALVTGMCDSPTGMPDRKCLQTVETRTGWWWHLFHALAD